jgi:hypothetical protein
MQGALEIRRSRCQGQTSGHRTGDAARERRKQFIEFSVRAGKPVADAGAVRSALKEARANGKHSVLIQVKNADRFVAMPLAKG